jgi:replication fork protection complex subunit TIMELESS/Tof1/Swi1
LSFGDDTLRKTVLKDGKLQLLLRLMGARLVGERGQLFQGFEFIIDDPDARWTVPSETTADDLETNLRFLKQFIDEPPAFDDGKSASDFLRRRIASKLTHDDPDSQISSSDESVGGSARPRQRSKKRKRRQLDDSELAARREKRRLADLEKKALIKSAARILDSDDDEEADREFFERERKLRDRMAARALEGPAPRGGTRRARKQKTSQVKPDIESLYVERCSDDIVAEELAFADEAGDDDSEEEMIRYSSHKKRKISRAIGMSSGDE